MSTREPGGQHASGTMPVPVMPPFFDRATETASLDHLQEGWEEVAQYALARVLDQLQSPRVVQAIGEEVS